MLYLRILTAIILIPLVVAAVFYLPSLYFSLLIAIIVLGGALEWCRLINLDKNWQQGLFLAALIFPMVGITFWTQFLELASVVLDWQELKEYSGIIEWLVVIPVLFWVMMMMLIRKAPAELVQIEIKRAYKICIGWLTLFFAWMFTSRLHLLYGSEMMMYFLLLIWIADSAAYFTGKRWGKHLLAPDISPGKTLEGVYGALVSSVLTALGLCLWYKFPLLNASDFVLLSILTVLISIYGDLFFSVVKRQKGVKDSGYVLPGHGGILDRIDSIISAAPFFYAGILLIGRGIFS